MPRKKSKHVEETESIDLSKSEITSTQTKSSNKTKTDTDKKSISDNQTNTIDEDIIEISQLKGKEIWHYGMINNFFSTCELTQIQRMVDIINSKHLISLRFLDWFVTRYCSLYKTTITVANQFCKQNNFNINISYKAQLKSFTKKYFDPFKRKKKFFFTLDKFKISFLTTVGQLNFFRWAITHDIINHAISNFETIKKKGDFVDSFFEKHSSSNSTSISNMSSSNISSSNMSSSNISLSNSSTAKSDSLDLASITDDIYSLNNNKKIVIENTNLKKSPFKIPRVTRNIYLEL